MFATLNSLDYLSEHVLDRIVFAAEAIALIKDGIDFLAFTVRILVFCVDHYIGSSLDIQVWIFMIHLPELWAIFIRLWVVEIIIMIGFLWTIVVYISIILINNLWKRPRFICKIWFFLSFAFSYRSY